MDQESDKKQLSSGYLQSFVEQRLHSFIESADDAMLLLDEDGGIILANELALSKTGYKAQELIGHHIEVLIPVLTAHSPVDHGMYQFAPHRRLGTNKDLKMFVCKKNGGEFPAKITFSSMSINEGIYLHVTMQDTWGKEIVEQKVLQHERILKETQRIAKIASWEWDAVTKELFYSDNFYNIVSIDSTCEISRYEDFLALIHEDDREYVEKAFWGAIKEGGGYNVQYRFVVDNENIVYVHDEAVVDFDAEQNPIRMTGFIQDITEQSIDKTALKKYAAELKEANDVAQAALEAKSQFLATMSHELRTPLNGVIGMASLLEGTELDDEQHEYVETIFYSGDALLTIINDILDYTKLDAGALELSMRPFNLWECIDEIVHSFYPAAVHKGLELLSHVAHDVPVIMLGDEKRFKQVLINLMSNAIKFTKKGIVEIQAHVIDKTHHGHQIQLSVIDTGIGVPENKLKYLFEVFQQLDNSIARQFGGTGVGLAICKRLVNLMNGKIGVESSSAGSNFWFTLRSPDVEIEKRQCVPPSHISQTAFILSQNEQFGNRIQSWLSGQGVSSQAFAKTEMFLRALADQKEAFQAIIDLQHVGHEYPAIQEVLNNCESETLPIYILGTDASTISVQEDAFRLQRPLCFKQLYKHVCKNATMLTVG